jgi:hypothetical protein
MPQSPDVARPIVVLHGAMSVDQYVQWSNH